MVGETKIISSYLIVLYRVSSDSPVLGVEGALSASIQGVMPCAVFAQCCLAAVAEMAYLTRVWADTLSDKEREEIRK